MEIGAHEVDIVGAGSRWIPENRYRMIQESVPIVCVDVLLAKRDNPRKVGLIHRSTYDNRFGWCLVGGAVLRNEPLLDAVERHVISTLGSEMSVDRSTLNLCTVIEYFTNPQLGDFHDPRKHAVALTYAGLGEGVATPIGEALSFDWFDVDDLGSVEFGFGQGEVVRRILAAPSSQGSY